MIRSLIASFAITLSATVGAAIVAAPCPAAAQSGALNGDWRGQSSGNVVRIREDGGGIYVVAVTNNAGQSEPLYFQRYGSNEFRYTFPDGNQAVVRTGSGSITVVNPDGWSDTFYPLNPRPAAPTYAPAPAYTPSVRTEGWPAPASPGVDTAILNAMARADQASRDAVERALTTPATPPK